MLTTGNQLKAARAMADLEQMDVATAAGVNVNTIRSMEKSGAGPIAGRSANVQAVQRALEAAGVEFLNHGQPGVRLNMARIARAAADDLDRHTGGNPDPKVTARGLRRFADDQDGEK